VLATGGERTDSGAPPSTAPDSACSVAAVGGRGLGAWRAAAPTGGVTGRACGRGERLPVAAAEAGERGGHRAGGVANDADSSARWLGDDSSLMRAAMRRSSTSAGESREGGEGRRCAAAASVAAAAAAAAAAARRTSAAAGEAGGDTSPLDCCCHGSTASGGGGAPSAVGAPPEAAAGSAALTKLPA